MPDLVRNVTADTYVAKAKAYSDLRQADGETYGVMPDLFKHASQRRAWRAYFHSKRIKSHWTDKADRAQFPAEWPSEFDVDWSVASDHGRDSASKQLGHK